MGSEMCIRDSISKGPGAGRPTAGGLGKISLSLGKPKITVSSRTYDNQLVRPPEASPVGHPLADGVDSLVDRMPPVEIRFRGIYLTDSNSCLYTTGSSGLHIDHIHRHRAPSTSQSGYIIKTGKNYMFIIASLVSQSPLDQCLSLPSYSTPGEALVCLLYTSDAADE